MYRMVPPAEAHPVQSAPATSAFSGSTVAAALVKPRMTGAVLGLLTGTALLVSFSESMLIPALPTIQSEYGASASAVSWVPAIYLLVGAVSVPLIGKLGDLHGRRRLLLIVMIAYSVAVILDGFSWDLDSLLAFRAIQGLGLAMFPLAIALIMDQLPHDRVPVGVGLLSAMNGVGSAVGLLLGAQITELYGWQTNYHLLAPFAVLLTALLAWRARESPIVTGESIDYRGLVLLGGCVALFLVAISEGGTLGWGSVATVTLFAGAIAFGVALAVAERRRDGSLLGVELPAFSKLLRVNFVTFVAGAAMFMAFYVGIYYAQEPMIGLGRDVAQAALILAPGAVLMLIFAPIGGRLCQRIGPREVQVAGLVLVVAGFLALLAFHLNGVEIALSTVVIFGGVGFLLTAVSVSVLALAPPQQVGGQTGLNTSFRTIGQAVGVSLSGAFLASFLIPHTELPSGLAYLYTTIVAIVLCGVAIGVALSLPKFRAPHAGTAVAG